MRTHTKQLSQSGASLGQGVVWDGDVWQPTETKDLAGFENRTDSTLAFNNTNRIFTISGAYNVYFQNIKYSITSPLTIEVPNVVGFYYIYLTSSGLNISTSVWEITTNLAAPTATVYWNGTEGELSDERHSYKRDRQLHKYLHYTRGAAWGYGYGGTFGNASFSIATGILWDEDIQLNVTGPLTTCRLWYRNSSNQMQFESTISTPYKAVASVLKYDNAGTLTDVPNNNYVKNWVYATNAVDYPISVVVGQSQGNLANARAAAQPNFPNLTTQEWKLLYSVVYRRTGGTTITFIESTDYRTSVSLPNATATALPAASVTYTPTGNITSIDVQAGLSELDGLMVHLAGTEVITGSKQFDAKLVRTGTDSSGTPGDAIINKPSGISAIASGQTTCTITNSLAATTSQISISWFGDHGAARSWTVRNSGNFVVTLSAAASADTAFGWSVEEIG